MDCRFFVKVSVPCGRLKWVHFNPSRLSVGRLRPATGAKPPWRHAFLPSLLLKFMSLFRDVSSNQREDLPTRKDPLALRRRPPQNRDSSLLDYFSLLKRALIKITSVSNTCLIFTRNIFCRSVPKGREGCNMRVSAEMFDPEI